MAKEAYYFSHDANSRNDPKILSMMLDYGVEGYGMFWIIVENMREQDGYKTKKEKSMYRALAMQLHKNIDKTKKFLEDCVNEYELFKDDGEFIYSESLLRRMKMKDGIREKRREAAMVRWDKIKEESNANAMQMHNKVDANAMQLDANAMQLDAKEKKVNKSKVNIKDKVKEKDSLLFIPYCYSSLEREVVEKNKSGEDLDSDEKNLLQIIMGRMEA